jgi:hypothetical protein
MNTVTITIEQLETLIQALKNDHEFRNMRPSVQVSIGRHPNKVAYVQFEQPCYYGDCNSHYHTFN